MIGIEEAQELHRLMGGYLESANSSRNNDQHSVMVDLDDLERAREIAALLVTDALEVKKDGTEGCPFCSIISGSAPAKFLADGISSIAIEPLNPVTEGHFLVIPRQHMRDAYDDPAVTAMAMDDAAQWAKMFSWRDKRYESVNIITSVGAPATQSVFHLHIHVVPRTEGDGLALPWSAA